MATHSRIPLAAAPVHHTDRKPALYPTDAASKWQPSLLRCGAFALFACVLSAILTEERPLLFQLRKDNSLLTNKEYSTILIVNGEFTVFEHGFPELLTIR